MSNVAQISRISLWKSKSNVRDTHLIQRFRHTVILDVTHVEEKRVLFFGEPRKIFKNCSNYGRGEKCLPAEAFFERC